MTSNSAPDATPAGIRLPPGVVLRPPVKLEDLAKDIELDAEESEALIELVRRLRLEGVGPTVR